jgi:hypothetical protein
MGKCVRIEQYSFGALSLASGTSKTYSNYSLNGEILKVEWTSNTAGSLFLTVSGTEELIMSRIAPSGAGYQRSYPRTHGQITTGSIAGATMFGIPVNGPLVLGVSGAASGATLTTLDLSVYSR